MERAAIRQLILAAAAGIVLAGCEDGMKNPFAKSGSDEAEPGAVAQATSVRLVDRDVEAPEVFQVSENALWDGRPSLGGVWVASPDAKDPERVILRNPANGKFVIGALFRRERDNPGPRLQISSDAAAALGLLAGQPAKLNITALRREEGPTAPDASNPILDAAETVETTPLPAAAAAAIDRAEAKPAPAPTPAAPAPATPAASGGLIQIGIFSVEANAKRAADTLSKGGVQATVRPEKTQGKDIWSVTAGPATDRAALLAKVKGLGFSDAYFLSR